MQIQEDLVLLVKVMLVPHVMQLAAVVAAAVLELRVQGQPHQIQGDQVALASPLLSLVLLSPVLAAAAAELIFLLRLAAQAARAVVAQAVRLIRTGLPVLLTLVVAAAAVDQMQQVVPAAPVLSSSVFQTPTKQSSLLV
jgi:hypothetical protein